MPIKSKRLTRLNSCRPPYATNDFLRQLVLNCAFIKDDSQQSITITHVTNGKKYYYDCTKQVYQLLKEGKLKRVREYGFGHSGNAGHTYFVKT